MAQSRIVVLNGGGVRSLAALATVANRQRVATLFVHDGRLAVERYRKASLDQAERYKVDRKLELTLPHLRPPTTVKTLEKPQGYAPMGPAQMLLAAAGAASQIGAETLIWPVQPGPDYQPLAAVTESLAVVEDLMRATLDEAALRIETPLLELTDRQVVEVGHQMDLPWELARRCLSEKDGACHACWGCYRWRKAFEEAGIEDPHPAPAGRG